MKLVTFDTAYAKLGNWPGRIGYQEGRTIFGLVSGLKARDSAIIIGAGFGRAVMLAGRAAKNIGAKLYAVERWGEIDPAAKQWFNKAVWLAGLTEIVVPLEPLPSPATVAPYPDAALTLVLDEAGRTVPIENLSERMVAGSMLFDPYGLASQNGMRPAENLPGGWVK